MDKNDFFEMSQGTGEAGFGAMVAADWGKFVAVRVGVCLQTVDPALPTHVV
jgi:hypothetical protein